MEAYQERVVQERADLAEKIVKLVTFIDTNPTFKTLADEDRLLMERQRRTMLEYRDILDDRIARFAPVKEI